MRRNSNPVIFQPQIIILIFFLISVAATSALAAAPFQPTPIMLKASHILPASLLAGENYRVEERVQNDGVINTYQLSTTSGIVFVESTTELMIRVNELQALMRMNEMERKGVFKDSLVAGVKAPVKLAGDLVTKPIESGKNIVKGTGSFISNVGRSIFSRDPHQDNVLKVALGYDTLKRKFAFEFLINPYSDYNPVVERLGEISRAALAGGILPRAAMMAVPGPAGTALSLSATAKGMKELVRDNPPGALRKINQEKLVKMGIEPELIEVFLDNHNYDPETQTILVGELDSMKGVQGRNFFIAAASLASEKTSALFYQATAQMMAGYHRLVAPAAHIGTIGGRPFIMNNTGILILPLPVDYIFWKIDEHAGAQFAARHWKIFQDANPILIK